MLHGWTLLRQVGALRCVMDLWWNGSLDLIPHHVLWILWRSEDKCYPGGKMPAED
jgi:hypothetical protein